MKFITELGKKGGMACAILFFRDYNKLTIRNSNMKFPELPLSFLV